MRSLKRSLEDLAVDNATRGCVAHTYNAIISRWQAARAGDRSAQRKLLAQSQTATVHAELAWQVAAHLEPKLTPAAQRKVDEARRAAARALFAVTADDDAALRELAEGLPADALPLVDAARRLL